jgi:hypothetical protein
MNDGEMESRMKELLDEALPPTHLRFNDGFADRVMARVDGEAHRADDLTQALARQSRRFIPALLAASMALLAWNWSVNRSTTDSAVAAALGLQPTTTVSSGLTTLQGAEAFQ